MNNDKENILKMADEFIQCLPGGFLVYRADEEEEIIAFNEEVLKIYGCGTDEEFRAFTGNSFKGMVHPDDLELVERNIALQIRKQNDLVYAEYRIICKDGAEKYVRDYGRFMHTKEYGDVYYIFIHDVTQNKLIYEREMNKYTSLITALSRIYSALYYIDIEKNTFQEIISSDSVHYVFGEKADAEISLNQMIQRKVADEYQAIMREFMDLNTIHRRMDGKSIIVQEYPEKTGGWTRCSFILMDNKNTEKVNKVICAFRCITSEKEVLEEQNNLIQALAIPYANIYMVNADTREAVCYRMSQTMNERYGQRFAAGNYEDNIRTYVENDVLIEDWKLFERVCTVDGVNELLADNKAYYFNYRVYRDGLVEYYQCQLIKPDTEKNEFVIAFKNVNEEKNIELAAQRKVEEALSAVEKVNAALQEESAVSTALSQEYSSLFKIDARTRRMTLYRTDGITFDPVFLEQLLALGDYEIILSKYIESFVVPEDRERIRESIRLSVLLEKVPEVGLYKLGYRRIKNGVISYFEMNTIKMVDNNGMVTFILGLRDVDEESRRQLKQTKEMEVQREIIEGLGSEYYSVLLVNPETDMVAFYRTETEYIDETNELLSKNQYCWSKLMHYYAQEQVSQHSRDEYLEKMSLEYIRARNEDYSVNAEVLLDGEYHYIQLRIAYVHEADGSCAVVIGTRNVDDLIKKERQQEMALRAAYDAAEAASKAKTDFLSNMSHDIRTPMNGIIGMTAIAASHIDDRERLMDSLQKITQASKHLLSLINEVLDMSKIESGKVELIEEEFNLSDLIDNLLSMTNSQIEEHHHELFVNISGVIHEKVVGDSLRIQKVFTNLMSNAVKYTPDGGKICLTISEKNCNQPKVACFEFVFEDNGIGMSEEFVKHIFEPFVRAQETGMEKIQGTGLGMTISRNIVRMMGGDIQVESTLGKGSRFIVTIYLKLQNEIITDYQKFVNLDVLVADDDAVSLESCVGMLCDLGMKAEGVSSGLEAVKQVIVHHEQKRDYFACIIDWKMPDMDGIETTRTIRKVVGPNVPIIIISAYDWSDIEQESRKAGANAFISKPIFRSKLERTFGSLLNQEEAEVVISPLDTLGELDYSKYRVLLVEDNELNAEIAEEILGNTGITVDHVWNGVEAVDRMGECEDGYYDLIFMDIQMPKMNGYDATRAIRSMKRNYCRQIPIVAMTANAFAEDVHSAKTVGMNEHIPKPLELKVLIRTLQKWLD